MDKVDHNPLLYPYGPVYTHDGVRLAYIPELMNLSEPLPVEVVECAAETLNNSLRRGVPREFLEGVFELAHVLADAEEAVDL